MLVCILRVGGMRCGNVPPPLPFAPHVMVHLMHGCNCAGIHVCAGWSTRSLCAFVCQGLSTCDCASTGAVCRCLCSRYALKFFFPPCRRSGGATLVFLIIRFTYFSHLHTSLDKLRTLNCVTSLSAPKRLRCLSIFRSLSGGFSFLLAHCCYNLSCTCVGLSIVWVPPPFFFKFNVAIALVNEAKSQN